MIYLNDRISDIDIEQALTMVNMARRQKALAYRHENDQRLSLAVYMLLCEGLEKEYGITEKPELIYGDHGKPQLRDYPDIHFNMSHCKEAALCVVDNRPVGCDIEMVSRKLNMGLCRYCCNDEEIDSVLSADNPSLEFIKLWTQKEAVVKLIGEGLAGDVKDILQKARTENVKIHTVVPPNKEYAYTIASLER